MNHTLNILNNTLNNTLNDDIYLTCDINHWMFVFLSGYIVPLFNTKFREYMKHILNKKCNKLDALENTLNEYGFLEIQAFKNNEEMKIFVKRLSNKMGYNIDDKMVEEISWLVSGEEDETHMSLEQSFDKLKSLILSKARP